jgi:hypothetical protein
MWQNKTQGREGTRGENSVTICIELPPHGDNVTGASHHTCELAKSAGVVSTPMTVEKSNMRPDATMSAPTFGPSTASLLPSCGCTCRRICTSVSKSRSAVADDGDDAAAPDVALSLTIVLKRRIASTSAAAGTSRQ